MREFKDIRCEVKYLDEDGTFEGYAATFGNVDRGGDVIETGAFTRTLSHWKEKGKPIPLLADHKELVGAILEAKEDDHGLRVKGKLLLGISKARELYEAMKANILDGMSIGYVAIGKEMANIAGKSVRKLKEIALHEITLTALPMNTLATVVAVKSEDELEQRIAVLEEELKALRSGALAAQEPDDSHKHSSAKVEAILNGFREYTRTHRRTA